MTEDQLKELLGQLLAAVAAHERDPNLGYQGAATPLRVGVYVEYQAADGRVLVVDNEHLAQTGTIALREWITVRGGKAGGKQDVKPGGSGVGGVGIPALLQLFGLATGNPLLGQIGGALGGGAPQLPPAAGQPGLESAIGSLLLGLLKGKVARHGSGQ